MFCSDSGARLSAPLYLELFSFVTSLLVWCQIEVLSDPVKRRQIRSQLNLSISLCLQYPRLGRLRLLHGRHRESLQREVQGAADQRPVLDSGAGRAGSQTEVRPRARHSDPSLQQLLDRSGTDVSLCCLVSRPGTCAGDGPAADYKSSVQFPDETLTFIKSYPLMDEAVPSVNDRPCFTRTSSR